MSTVTYEATRVEVDASDEAMGVGLRVSPNGDGRPSTWVLFSRATVSQEETPQVSGVYLALTSGRCHQGQHDQGEFEGGSGYSSWDFPSTSTDSIRRCLSI